MLIYFWEKLNVFENWTKAVNLILREKKNAHQPTTHCFAGLQRATDPRARGSVQGCGPLLLPAAEGYPRKTEGSAISSRRKVQIESRN